MNRTTRKGISTFLLFLLAVSLYGGIIALFNGWLRSRGYSSRYTTVVFVGCTVYVYYRCWLWLCRRLDSLK